MVDVIKSQLSEMLLSREQLHQIEHFQAQVGELERELTGTVDDFISVLNRHYFNRENGYLDEQQGNLREVVIIQSRLEKLAGKLAACTGELKTYMMALQKSLHGKAVEEPVEPKGKAEESAAAGVAPDQPPATAAAREPARDKKAPGQVRSSAVVNRGNLELSPGAESGGEVSLKLIFEELKLAEPRYSAVSAEISSAMRKLLYDRRLVGYGKTSLVFGKDKTLDQLLEELKPVFTSEALRNLLLEKNLITAEEAAELRLACNKSRELIFSVTG
ncbi:MAG: hypothetical protein A3F83_02265 [Candidatus Glassbacteria bacterium RIFCSPLOWO2_12_FULL_58_11]|uniref:Uncharacterized protein n=1 Tax=Candidatus Glassbacteria bacterium RIFCSPLOWO2_12_FULL_58_11 TaxID=1817867 RepID=A0A1F5YM00_9BACT|nr:MAG: hypothetical protein A3F83_02265 [Candidatus Glassbacteria bacterium RIFCSPLOWO2_12_FULL_58_11]